MHRELIITADGSHSLYMPDRGEAYHSRNGAITESEHVFIRGGLAALNESYSPAEILEVGFGSGLNALLSVIYARRNNLKIHYTALEPFRLMLHETGRLNYPGLMEAEDAAELFEKLHSVRHGQTTRIAPGFTLEMVEEKLENMHFSPEKFHLVYYDAFSPEVQAELWNGEIFTTLNKAMAPGGILVTYCCKGTVKRALRSAGFRVYRLPGPPGKRQMIRAVTAGADNGPMSPQ